MRADQRRKEARSSNSVDSRGLM